MKHIAAIPIGAALLLSCSLDEIPNKIAGLGVRSHNWPKLRSPEIPG